MFLKPYHYDFSLDWCKMLTQYFLILKNNILYNYKQKYLNTLFPISSYFP